MTEIADIISSVLANNHDVKIIDILSKKVELLCDRFPLYSEEHQVKV